jgi:hypothetical protein
MPENQLFETMYSLTKQLKGGPLKNYEKEAIHDVFKRSDGNPFERAEKAVAGVLHTTPDFIYEKGEALEGVNRMIEDMRKAAEAYGGLNQ